MPLVFNDDVGFISGDGRCWFGEGFVEPRSCPAVQDCLRHEYALWRPLAGSGAQAAVHTPGFFHKPTSQLRWRARRPGDTWAVELSCGHLQQLWTSQDGADEWRDLEVANA